MIDSLSQTFAELQGWLFESMVQPLVYRLGLMEHVEPIYEGLGTAMIGAIEIAVLVALLKPLERWRPVEQWADKRAVRADVVYTWLHRLGVLPLAIFFNMS